MGQFVLGESQSRIEVFHTRDQNHVTAGGDSILGVKLCNSCSGSGIDMLSKLAANLGRVHTDNFTRRAYRSRTVRGGLPVCTLRPLRRVRPVH